MASRMEDLTKRLLELGGSDLHLKVGTPPTVRVRGLLTDVEGYDALRPQDTEAFLKELIPDNLVGEFEHDGEADFSWAVTGVGRFRVNAFKQRGSVSIVMRFIPFGVPKLEDLNLPPAVAQLAQESIINQREVGTDTLSFARALRRVLRQDPDIRSICHAAIYSS
jgi:twitching motility protein PilT